MVKDQQNWTPVSKTRLREEIVSRLKDMIIRRELKPGERLPPERALAETFQVNRSSVREALTRLEGLDLVEIRHGSGAYIKDFLESGSLELARLLLVQDGLPDFRVLKNLAELRKLLVPEAASQAALCRNDEVLLELERLVVNAAGLPIVERDWRVNSLLGRASGNVILVLLINAFTSLLKDYSYFYFGIDENVQRSERFHREVFEAIRDSNAERAREVTVSALQWAEDAIFSAINAAGLP